ncbi:MAG: glycosyltransferase family 2 protein [Gemmobacter sp.]|uniref:glycosyltransferase n=1 Tax=Gemmobacter sp. TaxID=1898957 RepID=UPI001A648846|nr:glycosyltransferase family A protein [Gemmobacter sp.]MBL8562798.1 glycosyltransferase family 2 protein [Gemmobacter sp.]
MLSVIIPASNEESYIGPCLTALFASSRVADGAEVIVVANGCRDRTAEVARGMAARAAAAGWGFRVIERAEGGKPAALDAGDAAALGDLRAYLDADVIVSPPVMAQLAEVLSGPEPRYASGTAVIPPARSRVTQAYARFWQSLPFAQSVAPGYGLFAVNAAGRARWAQFPAIISDDTFVRLQFLPGERVQVAASYRWPMIEGFAALVRVRRRQDAGVAEIAARWPELMAREAKAPLGLGGLLARALREPLGFAVYAAVSLAVRAKRGSGAWVRGR